jgi:flagellar hook protein FlgE
MAAISDNITNSATVGYKRAAVDFSTLMTSSGSDTSYSAGGVQSNIRYQILQDGQLQGTQSPTDLALDGRGFFVVSNSLAQDEGTPSYGLTRAGSFQPDDNGFLRNSAGLYLQGWKLNPDGTLPNVSRTNFDSLQDVKIGDLAYGGSATTAMGFSGNLPAQAANGTTFETSGPFYDGLGNPRDLELTWTKTTNPNEWTLTATGPAGYTVAPASITMTFAATGPYAGMPVDGAGLPLDPMPSLTVTSPATPTADTFSVGLSNITQLNGDYVPQVTGNGAKAARVSTVSIDETGKLWAVYSNGARQALYQIPVADVMNPGGLSPSGGNVYTLSADSGAMTLNSGNSGPVGAVVASALEQSNVDIADELVSLIETQRAYSSNATIVRTADEMVEETTRLKR